MERFVRRHDKQKELCFLPVAQKEILADAYIQHFIDRLACLHCGGSGMVNPIICNTKTIQQRIDTDFPFLAALMRFRRAMMQLQSGLFRRFLYHSDQTFLKTGMESSGAFALIVIPPS